MKTTERDGEDRFKLITDENHPYGCVYEPAVVRMWHRVGNLLFIVPMNGERCKWCGEEFVSAKLLNELDEEFSQALTTHSVDESTKLESWTFETPAIHIMPPSISTDISELNEEFSSVVPIEV